MVVVFRTRGDDWDKFIDTLRQRRNDIEGAGATDVWVHRNRKHPEEWMMVQQWPDKAAFDRFADSKGPELDQEAGVRWTDVSTWEEVKV
jgi:quinol monooxygenase YgiN